MNRDKSMVRSASARALALATINGAVSGITLRELKEVPEIKKLGVPEGTLRNCVNHLGKNGNITLVKEGTAWRFFPRGTDLSQPAAPVTEQVDSKHRKPMIKIDIVKATGKVRIQLDGLLLEIGVV